LRPFRGKKTKGGAGGTKIMR